MTPYFSRMMQRAHADPDAPCYVFEDGKAETSATCAEFNAGIQKAAARLDELGVSSGEIVLIFAQHGELMLHAFFGAQLLGAIPAFMPPPTERQDMTSWEKSHRTLCQRIEPKLILADESALAPLQHFGNGQTLELSEIAAFPDIEPAAYRMHMAAPASIAFLQHSSGTTGLKKGVMVTYEQLDAQIEAYAKTLGLDGTERVVSWLPIYHDMGLIAGTILPFVVGLPVHWIHTFAWLARPQIFMTALARTPNAIAWLPNFAFPYLARQARDVLARDALSGVKAIINCSEPCKSRDVAAFIDRFSAYGLPPAATQVCYAMAEYVFAVTQTAAGKLPTTLAVAGERLRLEGRAVPAVGDAAAVTFLSCGVPIPGVAIRIMHRTNDHIGVREIGECEVGEIEISGSSLCAGYYRNEALTAERFVDGWYRTGDQGFIDGGELYVTGRLDDLIIIRGRNLYAHDIEASINSVQVSKAGRCVALGVPDDRLGTQRLVILAEEAGHRAELAEAAIIDRVYSEFGISPSEVIIVAGGVLTKTTSGKISRSANLAKYLSGQLESWRAAS